MFERNNDYGNTVFTAMIGRLRPVKTQSDQSAFPLERKRAKNISSVQCSTDLQDCVSKCRKDL